VEGEAGAGLCARERGGTRAPVACWAMLRERSDCAGRRSVRELCDDGDGAGGGGQAAARTVVCCESVCALRVSEGWLRPFPKRGYDHHPSRTRRHASSWTRRHASSAPLGWRFHDVLGRDVMCLRCHSLRVRVSWLQRGHEGGDRVRRGLGRPKWSPPRRFWAIPDESSRFFG